MKAFWIIFSILDIYIAGKAIYHVVTIEWDYIPDDVGIMLLTLAPIPLIVLTGISAILHLGKKRSGIWFYFSSVPLRVLTAFMSLNVLLYLADPYQSYTMYYIIVCTIITFELFRIIISILMLRKSEKPVYNNA